MSGKGERFPLRRFLLYPITMKDFGTKVAQKASSLVGAPYRMGGFCPDAGIDCLGLWFLSGASVNEAFLAPMRVLEKITLYGKRSFEPTRGRNLEAADQWISGSDTGRAFSLESYVKEVPAEEAEAGDLLIYKSSSRGWVCDFHCAVVANDPRYVYHASRVVGVVRTPRNTLPTPERNAWRFRWQ